MANNSINVYFEDKTGGGVGGSDNGTTARANANSVNASPQSTRTNQRVKALAVASMIGQGAFQYASSNVGKFTGDSNKQQQVNNAIQGIQMGLTIFANPTLGLTAMGIQGITWSIDNRWKMNNQRVASNQALARAGYTSSADMTNRRIK